MRHVEFEDPRLVAVYDAEHVWGWDDDFFMAVLAERNAPRVLDFGCGTGRLAIRMAEAGHQVTAVDRAGACLDAARRKPGGERVRWIEGSTRDIPGEDYDTVMMTGHVVQYLSDGEWVGLLSALHEVIEPGGRLIFDSRDPDDRAWTRWVPEATRRSVVLTGGETVRAWTEASEDRRGLVTVVEHFVLPADTAAELTSTTQLRFRDEEELTDTLEDAGFEVADVYGGWSREPVGAGGEGELIFVALAR